MKPCMLSGKSWPAWLQEFKAPNPKKLYLPTLLRAQEAIVMGAVEGDFPIAGRHHGKSLVGPGVWQGVCILRTAGLQERT